MAEKWLPHQARGGRRNRLHTKPDAGGEIGSVPGPLSLMHILVPMACGTNPLVNTPPLAQGVPNKVDKPFRKGGIEEKTNEGPEILQVPNNLLTKENEG